VQGDRPSWTAEMVAAVRADHRLHDRPVVCDDPFALPLCSAELRAAIESGEFHRGFERGALRQTQGHLVARARYADDALRNTAARGVRQVLVLAAGLDSTALRCDPALRVVEVDHPATQALKRERLAALGPRPGTGAGLEFAAVDFESTSLAQGLAATRYDPTRASFATWMGVTMYLDAATLRTALTEIRGCIAPGSELVFDHAVPLERLSGELRRVAEEKGAFTAAHGEPKRAGWSPEAMRAELAALGFELVGELEARDLDARYYVGRSDGLRASDEHRIVHARVP
jgi:methyltransferase (TIGR00027 family)